MVTGKICQGGRDSLFQKIFPGGCPGGCTQLETLVLNQRILYFKERPVGSYCQRFLLAGFHYMLEHVQICAAFFWGGGNLEFFDVR